MCKNCFESESWKKKSAAGKANRSKSAPYMGGSKSLVQHLEEYQSERSSSDSTSVGKYIEVYKKTHWSQKAGWQNDKAEEYHNSMKELLTEKLSQLPEGSQLPFDEEEEIYSQVLSNQKYEKYGFKRGTGPIVKRKATTSSTGGPSQRAFVQNLEDKVQTYQNRLEEMELKMKAQEEMMAHLLQQLNRPSEHPGNPTGSPLPPPPPPPPPASSAATC